MPDKDDGLFSDNPTWIKYLVLAAVFNGAGNSFVLLNKESKNYVSRDEMAENLEHRDRKINQVFDYVVTHTKESSIYMERIDRIGKELLSLREVFEKHRENRSCEKSNRSVAKETSAWDGPEIAEKDASRKEFTAR